MPRTRTRRPKVVFYAWSRITIPHRTNPGEIELLQPGDKVTPDMLNQRDWDQLVEAGSIRSREYPQGVRVNESPRTAQLRKIREMQEDLEKGYHDLDREPDEVEVDDDDDEVTEPAEDGEGNNDDDDGTADDTATS